MSAGFVKSRDTSTSVANSKAAVEKMLVRYGASAFAVTHDFVGGTAQVAFRVKDSLAADAPEVPVRLTISVQRVYHALYGVPTKYGDLPDGTWGQVHDPKGYDAKKLAQAERVAWRNLVLWIDAALSTAAVNLQTITETFFAHAVIGENGETGAELVRAVLDPSRLLPGTSAREESDG